MLGDETRRVRMLVETRPWTIAEVDRLPDDGNAYEVARGDLFVTPTPSYPHSRIVSNLVRLMLPYLGDRAHLQWPRSVMIFEGSRVEPDLMVRPDPTDVPWEKQPTPLLIIEVVSDVTARRDRGAKRSFYRDAGVA